MAQLTWRDVAAPDLSTSLQGYAQFSNLLNGALGNARGAVQQVQDQQNTAANNKVALAALAVQDPTQMTQMLSDGSLTAGVNPNVLSAQTIAMLGARTGQLTAQQAATQNLSDSKYLSTQMHTEDAAAPALEQGRMLATQAATSGKPEDAAAYSAWQAANPNITAGFGFKDANQVASNLQSDTKAGTDLRASINQLGYSADANSRANVEASQQTGRYNNEQTVFGQNQDAYKAGQAADGFMATVNANSDPSNPDTVTRAIYSDPNFINGSPAFRAAVLNRAATSYPALFQAGAQPAAPGTPAATPGTNATPWTTAVGGGQLPAGVTTVQQAMDYGNTVLVPGNRNSAALGLAGTGKGSSAMGAYQITAPTIKTYAPDALGAGWQQANFTDPMVQDKIGRAIFNGNSGSNDALTTQWASLKGMSPTQLNAIRAGGWDNAKAVIASRESSASANSMAAVTGAPATQVGLALRQAQDNYGQTPWAQLAGASMATGPGTGRLDVISSMMAPGQRFAGGDPQAVGQQLDTIVNGSKDKSGHATINYPTAAMILQNNTTQNAGAPSWLHPSTWNVTNWLEGRSAAVNPQGDRVDQAGVDNDVANVRSGRLPAMAAAEAGNQWNSTNVGNLQSTVWANQAELAQLANASANKPGLGSQVTAARAKLQASQVALATAQKNMQPQATPYTYTPPVSTGSRIGQMFSDIANGRVFSGN